MMNNKIRFLKFTTSVALKLGCSHAPASRLSSTDISNIILIVISSMGIRLPWDSWECFGAAFRRPENCQALKLTYHAAGANKHCQNM